MRASRGRAAVEVPDEYAGVLESYVAALASAPAEQSRRTYASKGRQYLVWLVGAEVDADPLGTIDGRDWAVRDYRRYLQSVFKRSPATVNGALAAVVGFLHPSRAWPGECETRRGSGRRAASAQRQRSDPVPAGGAGVLFAA